MTQHFEVRAEPHDQPRADRLVRTLAMVVFLEWVAGGAFLPLFPVYLHHQGASSTVVGLVVGAFFLAGLVGQYPAGKLIDRIGARNVLLGGQLLYALSIGSFLLFTSPIAAVILRFTQGLGAGAAEVASLSIVALVVAPERRGRAFATIYGAQLSGTIIGPILGAAFGVAHMNWLFATTTLLTLSSSVPVLLRPELHSLHTNRDLGATLSRLKLSDAAKGSLLLAVAFGLVIGTYDASWSLLLREKGAGDLAINLSWICFSAPFVLASRPAGWMADHFDRRMLALIGVGVEAVLCSLYPFLTHVWIMLALATIEAFALAAALPAGQSLLTVGAANDAHGRLQGLYATCQMGAMTVAAVTGGLLFGHAAWLPFVAMAGASVVVGLGIALRWRGVDGKVSHAVMTSS